ncbi:MAG: cache domain-containing protein [Nitrospirota bacterium]|jgi:signal transduction histidine kinase
MQKRILVIIVMSMLMIFVGLAVVSYLSVRHSIKSSLDARLTLAQIVSDDFDYVIESNLTRLYDMSIAGEFDLQDNDPDPELKAIRRAYEYSIFSDGIFVLDRRGQLILGYPDPGDAGLDFLSMPYVSGAVAAEKPVISDVYTEEITGRKVIYALVPLHGRDGETIGVAGGEINPTSYEFSRIIQAVPSQPSRLIELIDSRGIVIASNDSHRVLTRTDHDEFLGNLIHQRRSVVGTCHRCHEQEGPRAERTEDTLAFAPLSLAPWGVTVREPREIVFAPSSDLKVRFAVLGLLSLATALLLSLGLSRSIVRPVRELAWAAKRIGQGNLSWPVAVQSSDELGSLATSFDEMRVRLAYSLESIQRQNLVLEQRVADRTRDLAASHEKLQLLLKRLITAEEEERKRVARELHDDTSQALNAILMSLDAVRSSVPPEDPQRDRLATIREHCLATLRGLHRLIRDLRPPVLDDLGLESAIRWVLESRLRDRNIDHRLEVDAAWGEDGARVGPRLERAQTELLLFRVIQEAVTNIVKHAHATHVQVTLRLEGGRWVLRVQDDGIGFDPNRLASDSGDDAEAAGYGILGMKERVALLDGEMTICSNPGAGTEITVVVPG